PRAPFSFAVRACLAMTPVGLRPAVAVARCRERYAGFEAFEFDAGAGTGAEQPIGRLAQPGPALQRVAGKGRVERRQERSDVAIDPRAQFLIDKSPRILIAPARLGVPAIGAAIEAAMRPIAAIGRETVARLDRPRLEPVLLWRWR